MKAALKFIMTTVGLLLIGMFLFAVLLLTQFENYLRDGLTYQAGRVLQCEVHMEGVRLDWSKQALIFKGITLLNPEAFTDREAIRIGAMLIQPDPMTIFSKTPGVARIALRDVQVHLQYKLGTGSNIGALADHARVWSEMQDAEERPVWGRRLKLHNIQSDSVSVTAEGLVPPTPTIALTAAPFTIESPEGDASISGARIMYLLLRGLTYEIRQVDGIVPALKNLLPGPAVSEPA